MSNSTQHLCLNFYHIHCTLEDIQVINTIFHLNLQLDFIQTFGGGDSWNDVQLVEETPAYIAIKLKNCLHCYYVDKFFIKTCQQLEEEYLCTLFVSLTVKLGKTNCHSMAKYFSCFPSFTDLKKPSLDAAVTTIDRAVPIWERARISLHECKAAFTCKFKKVVHKLKLWRKEQTKLKTGNQKNAETVFHDSLEDLFHMAHQNAQRMIKIEADRQSLLAQREKVEDDKLTKQARNV